MPLFRAMPRRDVATTISQCVDMHTIVYKIIVAGRHSKPFPGAHIYACIHTYIHTYMHIIHTSRQRFQQYNALGGPRAGSHQSPGPASSATKLLEATTCAFALVLASSAPVARSAEMQAVTTYCQQPVISVSTGNPLLYVSLALKHLECMVEP